MSTEPTSSDEELLREAKRLAAHVKTYNFGMWSADKLAHEIVPELIARLEELQTPTEHPWPKKVDRKPYTFGEVRKMVANLKRR